MPPGAPANGLKGRTVTIRSIIALVPLVALAACAEGYDPNDPYATSRPAPYTTAAICYQKQGPATACSDDLQLQGVLPANAGKECPARFEPAGAAPFGIATHLYSTSSSAGQAEAAAWLKQQRTALACSAELTLK
jgi:hypothetical protein